MGAAHLPAGRDGGAGLGTRGLVSAALDRGRLPSSPQNGLSHGRAADRELRGLTALAGTAGSHRGAALAVAHPGPSAARATRCRDPATQMVPTGAAKTGGPAARVTGEERGQSIA